MDALPAITPSPRRRSKQATRSAVTNGTRWLLGADGRSAWARRCRDLYAGHLADAPDASVAEASILRRASVLETELEKLESRFALDGEASDARLDLYGRTSSNLRRLLEAVGLQRRSRDITPTLAQYLEQRGNNPQSKLEPQDG